MLKQDYRLDQAMNSLIKTAEFKQNFDIPKLSQYEPTLDGAVLQLLDLSDKMEKLGGLQASRQLLKIASSILEDVDPKIGYEVCATCGFDHEYDGAYPGMAEKIKEAHEEHLPFGDEDDEYTKNVESDILQQREENTLHDRARSIPFDDSDDSDDSDQALPPDKEIEDNLSDEELDEILKKYNISREEYEEYAKHPWLDPNNGPEDYFSF